MKNQKRLVKILIIVFLLVLLQNLKVEAAELEENLNNLKGEITSKDFEKFISKDKEYLSNLLIESNLKSEIKKLEKELEKVIENYEMIEGIKVYKGNTGLKNSAIRTAIKNRKSYIKNDSFVYDEITVYNIDRGYMGEEGTDKYFTQKNMDIAYDAIVEVINGIELDTNFLNNTTFVVSPFILKGMNGYTVSRSTNHSTIVISNNIFGAKMDWKLISTRSTVLHEMGHVFKNSKKEKFKTNLLAQEYLLQTDKILQEKLEGKLSETQKWKASVNENFAEDFRVHFSKKLGKKSFKPLKKKTPLEYNMEEFTRLIAEIRS